MTVIDADSSPLALRGGSALHSAGAAAPRPPRSRERALATVHVRAGGSVDFLDRMGHRYGNVSMLRTPLKDLVVMRGPDAVRHVLLGNQDTTASPTSTSCSSRSSARGS